MQSFTETELAYLASGAIMARRLLWITARNRTTGAAETLGLWDGDDHQDFVIGGQTRTYFGAGGLIGFEPLVAQVGLAVRVHTAHLSPLTPEVAQVLRGYEPRLAPVEIHRALFWPDSHNLVATPRRVFKGQIDHVQITTPEIGGTAVAEVQMVSVAASLTRSLALKKSDEAQKRRSGDRFRRYSDVSGAVDVWWGEERG